MLSTLPGLGGLTVVVGLAGFGFMVGLIRALARAKPHLTDLPDLERHLGPRLSFGILVTGLFLALGVLVALGLIIGPTFSLMLASALIALGIAVVWRRELTGRIMAVSVVACLGIAGGILLLGNGDLSWAIFMLLVVPPLFAAGALLTARSGLAHSLGQLLVQAPPACADRLLTPALPARPTPG